MNEVQVLTRDGLRASLLDFFRDTLPRVHPRPEGYPAIDSATPLFESGAVDSLGILPLISFVEQAIGRRVPSRMVVMKHFRTVDAICESFVEE